ncbi:MAG: GreA/GreB family elongation factor [Sphaerochaeta sp.]|nr:GreA/GreB family elongation factor [Sphaerochaeta sp.]MCI2044918.1 GreA/GreB family elongation factor [Sphaerochaeta sp.]MCI2075775.1 GreA/GreB family elongation factor [Sphaerochaeta sp.]MCI2096452.1 GreA/GreB family elongation factor [Sphaerochaeta sp.]MCI2103474.1 GreA/GreB family elongation factor [Sphaerochaeta sp.]
MGMVRKDTRTHYTGTLYCTKEAFDANRAELRDITDKQIPETTREKSIAREKGDLRENSEYDAAKLKLAQLYARQREIAERIKNVAVVFEEAIHTDVAGFGTHVTLQAEDGSKSGITLAGEWDDMPEANIISIASPLGKEILGKKVGDSVTFAGHTSHITAIEKAKDLFGHYREHHPVHVEEQEQAKDASPATPVISPNQAIETAFSMMVAGKEKDEVSAFLSGCGVPFKTIQPLAVDYLVAKASDDSVRSAAIMTLNVINDGLRMEQA